MRVATSDAQPAVNRARGLNRVGRPAQLCKVATADHQSPAELWPIPPAFYRASLALRADCDSSRARTGESPTTDCPLPDQKLIAANRSDTEMSRRLAISFSPPQNASSRVMLVLCPAIVTERLATEDLSLISRPQEQSSKQEAFTRVGLKNPSTLKCSNPPHPPLHTWRVAIIRQHFPALHSGRS